MPNIAVFHPQIVHFVIALFFVGFGVRIASFFLWPSWTKPAGTALLVLAALASVGAVQSGKDAHGPVERIPGARAIVEHHEEKGEDARTFMLVVAAIELIGLAFAGKPAIQRGAHVVSALAGLFTGYVLFEAAEHGGEIVYDFGGGPGLRGGDTTDVRRLLVAGLYNQAQSDREAGRSAGAARLIEELVRRMPGDTSVALLAVESKIKDRNDPQGALTDLAAITVSSSDSRLVVRHALLTAEALKAAGMVDSAKVLLTALQQKFPDSRGVKQAIEALTQ